MLQSGHLSDTGPCLATFNARSVDIALPGLRPPHALEISNRFAILSATASRCRSRMPCPLLLIPLLLTSFLWPWIARDSAVGFDLCHFTARSHEWPRYLRALITSPETGSIVMSHPSVPARSRCRSTSRISSSRGHRRPTSSSPHRCGQSVLSRPRESIGCVASYRRSCSSCLAWSVITSVSLCCAVPQRAWFVRGSGVARTVFACLSHLSFRT